MEKYSILLGYFNKQLELINRLQEEVSSLEVHIYDKRYVFALKTQQFYTAIEDLFKQIAKTFENNIEELSRFHKELLVRMNTEIPNIRPMVIQPDTRKFLDKILVFRHFIRHAYDCELDEKELVEIQNRLKQDFHLFNRDIEAFKNYLIQLS